MKSKKLVIALTMTLVMGLGVTAYATTKSDSTTHQNVGLKMVTGTRGYDYLETVLKDKLGMTSEEISAGLNSGKTMYDLAVAKGMTVDQFKEAILEERNKGVDKAVQNGKISKEEGDSLKETIKNNLDNCNIPGEKNSTNKSKKGNCNMKGSAAGNCKINNTLE